MDLKSFLPKNKKEATEHYWSIIIEPTSVQAGVWKITEGKAEIVSRSPISAWEELDELINATDAVLASAVSELDDDIDPEKTVFGVVASWVDDGQIIDEHLQKIRKLCAELSLKPAGFVVLSEAVSNYIKSEEGSPLSGVVVGVSSEVLEISVFKLGRLLGSTKVSRSISVIDDVVEGLTRFADSKEIPSRFILYDGKEGELEEIKQELVKANWDDFDKITFLHTPKFEILTNDQKIDAVSLAGAVDIAQVTELVGSASGMKTQPDAESNVEEVSPEELGFALGEDITKVMGEGDSDSEEQNPSGELVINDRMGEASESLDSHSQKTKQVTPESPNDHDKKSFFPEKLLPSVTNLPSLKLSKKVNKNVKGSLSVGMKALIVGIIFIVILFGGGFAMWWYYPKASVTLYLTTNQLEERLDVKIDPNVSEANLEDSLLPGRILTTTVKEDKTTKTTGTTVVGDRATGSVTLYRVGTEISLDPDTVITGPSGLEFTLDESVTVASGSASTPGKTNVNVTAVAIGEDYNLEPNTTFKVDGYSLSDIEGKNSEAFSGGSSREISAVSKDDQERLKNDLEKELLNRALSELESDIEPGDVLIAESAQVIKSDSDFNKKVGDEADSLSLVLEEEIQVVAINEQDLLSLARRVLEDRIPPGYVLRDDQINVDFEFKEENDGVFILQASVKANLFSEVDPERIADQISGKYPKVAESFLINEIPGFVRAQINLRPRLRGKLGTLPHVPKNIEIEIAADR